MAAAQAAGIVLGTLSLVVCLVQRLEALTCSIENARPAIKDLKDIAREISTQKLIIRDTIQDLLSETLPQSEVHDLLEDPLGTKWQGEIIDQSFKLSLGDDGYKIFLLITLELFDSVTPLAKSLQKIMQDYNAGRTFPLSTLRRALRDRNKNEAALRRIYLQRDRLSRLALLESALETSARSQAIKNLRISLDAINSIQSVTQTIEDLSTGRIAVSTTDNCESASIYSVESEGEIGEPTLSYLPLSLEHSNMSRGTFKQDALLDTGASACAISVGLCSKLGLSIEECEETTVRTAVFKQELHVRGRTQLKARWKDNQGERFGCRMWVFVVDGLIHPIILSHNFTHRHPEVWKIAKTVVHAVQQMNATWFDKLSRRQQEAEDKFREKCLHENEARAEAEIKDRIEELERKLGDIIQNPATGPSVASVTTPNFGSTAAGT